MRADRALIVAGAALTLAGCALAPAYHAPETLAPPLFKEADGTGGLAISGWAAATPRDGDARGPWWSAFHDPVLDDLEARAEAASPTLAAALARYDSALASTRAARADLYPQVGVSASDSENKPSASGEVCNSARDADPAETPNGVTRLGSPPKPTIWPVATGETTEVWRHDSRRSGLDR